MLWVLALLACKTGTEVPPSGDPSTDDPGPPSGPGCDEVQPVVDAACLDCHGPQLAGGLDLRDLQALVGVQAIGGPLPYVQPGDRQGSYLWLKLTDQHLQAGGLGAVMPPPPAAPLSADALDRIGTWIDQGATCQVQPPGDTDLPPVPVEVGPRPRFARLTHLQWENTMRDLLGLPDTGQSSAFLGDVLSPGGFDNDATALQVTPELWSDYQRGAEAIARAVVNDPALYQALVPADPAAAALLDDPIRLQPEDGELTATAGGAQGSVAWNLWSNGELWADVDLPPGAWILSARVYGQQAGPDLARAALRVDGAALLTADVAAASLDDAEVIEVPFVATGAHRVAVAFTNDYYQDGADRNLVVDWLELRPALDPTYDPATQRPLAEAWIADFGERAHRRPLSAAEVDRYLTLFDVGTGLEYTGLPFRDGIYTVLLAMLQSPWVVYRVELEEAVDPGTGFIPLDGWTIASKLSYGLWNTQPDAALRQAAADGALLTPAGVRAEAARMLADPRAAPAVDHFHRQLLHLDSYANIYKDPQAFPQWSPALNPAMADEALLYTRDAVLQGASIFGFYTAPHTFVSDALAPLYGLTVNSPTPVRVDLDPDQRAGLLTQIGFLAANARAAEVDSIHRGVFVNLRLLCSDLPPPPAVLPPLPPVQDGVQNRDRVEQHTGVGTCGQGCHSTMINPVGFAFENFDALGQWQTQDAGAPIRADGSFQFRDGWRSWDDVVGFAAAVGESEDAHRCLIGNWMRYTHGRDLSAEDWNLVDRLGASSRSTDAPLRELLLDLVAADAFLTRAPEVTP